ncbi:MAG TPA: ferric reductase-like transmembrane domain-containing protein, partial [Acidimicrobiales bacterium]
MTASTLAAVGHGSTALWYLTRATGLVALMMLSATVVIGVVASVGWTSERWPRFLSQSVHRNLSLFCIALIGVHVVTTVGDGYVPIGLADAIIPFRSPYRPFWVGLGAVAFDMLLAVAVTSALRRRIGVAAWRGVHWLAYACWPIAVVHGLGAGSDARVPGAMLVLVLCAAAVAAALAWRLAAGRARSVTWRLGGAVAGAAVLVVITAFAAAGPLRPGWSHRAGTSSALLAQLPGSGSASYSSAPATTTSPTVAPPASGIPTTP